MMIAPLRVDFQPQCWCRQHECHNRREWIGANTTWVYSSNLCPECWNKSHKPYTTTEIVTLFFRWKREL